MPNRRRYTILVMVMQTDERRVRNPECGGDPVWEQTSCKSLKRWNIEPPSGEDAQTVIDRARGIVRRNE